MPYITSKNKRGLVLSEYQTLAAAQAGGVFVKDTAFHQYLRSIDRKEAALFAEVASCHDNGNHAADGQHLCFYSMKKAKEILANSDRLKDNLPPQELAALKTALDQIEKDAAAAAPGGIGYMLKEFKLPDPARNPEMYRLYGPFWKRRLVVLWGVESSPNTCLAPLAVSEALAKQVDTGYNWKRWLKLFFLLLLLLGLLFGLWYFLLGDDEKSRSAPLTETPPVPSVTPIVVTPPSKLETGTRAEGKMGTDGLDITYAGKDQEKIGPFHHSLAELADFIQTLPSGTEVSFKDDGTVLIKRPGQALAETLKPLGDGTNVYLNDKNEPLTTGGKPVIPPLIPRDLPDNAEVQLKPDSPTPQIGSVKIPQGPEMINGPDYLSVKDPETGNRVPLRPGMSPHSGKIKDPGTGESLPVTFDDKGNISSVKPKNGPSIPLGPDGYSDLRLDLNADGKADLSGGKLPDGRAFSVDGDTVSIDNADGSQDKLPRYLLPKTLKGTDEKGDPVEISSNPQDGLTHLKGKTPQGKIWEADRKGLEMTTLGEDGSLRPVSAEQMVALTRKPVSGAFEYASRRIGTSTFEVTLKIAQNTAAAAKTTWEWDGKSIGQGEQVTHQTIAGEHKISMTLADGTKLEKTIEVK